ncbi:hypothetical protein F511_31966 [Dorcoceras hygrometricum]|uniref:Uncharacterized protein n=1 Tax=Dorcoceras hygrometricum TaxID=472368 RepID=A0A2Z7CLM4_9LAMI|nr:hypothetical protein F511_31966 [Dorcoceras hygrometricum]
MLIFHRLPGLRPRQLLLTGATPAQPENPKILSIEFSTQAEHAHTAATQPAQQEGQVEEIVMTVEDVKETEAMDFQEHQAQGKEQQAQTEERQAQGGEHQTHREPEPEMEQEDERRAQTCSSHSSSRYCIFPSTTLQFKRQLDNNIDGMEAILIRHFADSQQYLVDKIALLKSHVAEMVSCLKELRDAKRGKGRAVKREGTSEGRCRKAEEAKEKVKMLAAQSSVEARSQAAPAKSTSETSLDADLCSLAWLRKRRGAKRKLVVESSDSEATVSVPHVLITKKHRTKRTRKKTHTADQSESQPGPIPDIPAGGDKESTACGPEATM